MRFCNRWALVSFEINHLIEPSYHFKQFSGPSIDEEHENEVTTDDESKEWMRVCYDENVIEYDEYSDCQDEEHVQIVEVHSEHLVNYTERVECEETQYENVDDTDLQQAYQVDEEEVYCITTDGEQKFVGRLIAEAEAITASRRTCNDTSSHRKRQKLKQNLRSLRLKCFIERENNRLKKKLLNCRICGTHTRFLDMQIRLLQAEKQKLVEETTSLRLVKEKLLHQVEMIESNLIVE